MPPFDEAIFSLDIDGNVRWRWRPREVDNDDLAYGAVPNLFSIDLGDGPIDVVGIGNKDGTYVRASTATASTSRTVSPGTMRIRRGCPYWRTQVVPGGAFGGVVATASVDEQRAARLLHAPRPATRRSRC